MEARRFFQPIPHRQAQPRIIGTLGENLRHVRSVEGTQGIEYPLGLRQLVRGQPQPMDDMTFKIPGELVKADDPRFFPQQAPDHQSAVGRVSGHCRHRRLGCVVTVLHPRRTGLFPVLQKPGDGLIYRHRTQHLLQRLQRQSAGAQQPGRRHRQVDDGGLHPHRTRPAVHDAVDLAVHILRHVACRGGAGPPGGVAAGGRHRHTGSLDDGPCHRMIRAAHAHRLQPAGSLQGNNLPPGQDHGQRPRPEPFRQTVGRLRYLPAVPLQPRGIRHMDDEGIILRTALGLENMAHRRLVEGVRPQTVYRLRGDAQQPAPPQDSGGLRDGVCIRLRME